MQVEVRCLTKPHLLLGYMELPESMLEHKGIAFPIWQPDDSVSRLDLPIAKTENHVALQANPEDLPTIRRVKIFTEVPQ